MLWHGEAWVCYAGTDYVQLSGEITYTDLLSVVRYTTANLGGSNHRFVRLLLFNLIIYKQTRLWRCLLRKVQVHRPELLEDIFNLRTFGISLACPRKSFQGVEVVCK